MVEMWVGYTKEDTYPHDIVGTLVWEITFTGIADDYPGGAQMPFCNLEMYQSENKTIHVYVKDRDLDYIDITGGTGVFTVKAKKTDVANLIQKSTAVSGEGELGAPDKGEMYFYM
ncbi:unnamed protein product, partial [marine sediment metagenome]